MNSSTAAARAGKRTAQNVGEDFKRNQTKPNKQSSLLFSRFVVRRGGDGEKRHVLQILKSEGLEQ